MSADRNLLVGIIALQLDFITRDQLIAGMQAWVLEKSKSLAEILESNGALKAIDRQVLEPLVNRHVEQHQNDPQESLKAVSSLGSGVVERLRGLLDQEVNASLGIVGTAKEVDPDATASVGRSTSSEGRFRILHFYKAGGLGKVSVAHDSELHRNVALKEILDRFANDEVTRSRFVVEAEVTGGLEHPGIVPVYGLGTFADGRPFYAMRFIEGKNLKDAISHFHDPNRKWKDSGERILELRGLLGRFVDVCQAIEYAHSRGVLHRDLKPGNIMLGNYGETLVVDWGLAKAQGKSDLAETPAAVPPLVPNSGSSVEPTIMGQMIGTLQYMSPEQAHGRLDQLGKETDIFGLGATLYQLLTGKSAYQDVPEEDLITRVKQTQFPAPRKVLKSVPPPLEAICLKAMAAKPSERYASAKELFKDIERYLADAPVVAYREPLLVRVQRTARKNPGPVSAFAATLLVSLVGLGAGLYFVNLERAKTEAARVHAETNSYRSDLTLADKSLALHDFKTAEQALNRTPAHLRNAEYLYLSSVYNSTVTDLFNPSTKKHDYHIYSLAWHPTELILAVGTSCGIEIWNSSTRTQIHALCPQTANGMNKTRVIVFSRDGALLAAIDDHSNCLFVWEWKTKRLVHVDPEHNSHSGNRHAHVSLSFSNDDKSLAEIYHGRVRIRDIASWEVRWQEDNVDATSITFSQDGNLLFIGDRLGGIVIRNTLTGKKIREIGVFAYADEEDEAQKLQGAQSAITTSRSRSGIRTFSLDNQSLIKGIVSLPDNERFACASENGTVRIFNLSSGCREHTWFNNGVNLIELKICRQNDALIAVSAEGRLSILNTTKPYSSFHIRHQEAMVCDCQRCHRCRLFRLRSQRCH